ncbi:efflux RND transporter periplasmic adaptor subunit [Patescibacteria group bacterium]|nr:efflux RND transporter periplasmic adaptor subunit [Patescibacteria group bacterium]
MKSLKNIFKKRIGKFILLIIILGLIYIGYISIFSKTKNAYASFRVKKGNIEETVSSVGNVIFGTLSQVNFPITGKLSSVYVKDGQNVIAGQKLASLTTTTLSENVQIANDQYSQAQQKISALYAQAKTDQQTAQNAVNVAQQTLNSDTSTLNTTPTSSSTYQSIYNKVQSDQLQLQIAQSNLTSANGEPYSYNLIPLQNEENIDLINLEQAQNALSKATITSPITGKVIFVSSITPGEEVPSSSQGGAKGIASAQSGISNVSGNSFITVANTSSAQIFAYIDESSISQIKDGENVNITLAAYPSETFSGSVISIEPSSTIIQNVVNYGVTISIKNPPSNIKLGMSANINVITQTANNVLEVPNSAINYGANGKTYVIEETSGKTLKRIPVKIGISNIYYTSVISGINSGDQVIVNPTSKIKSKLTAPILSKGKAFSKKLGL